MQVNFYQWLLFIPMFVMPLSAEVVADWPQWRGAQGDGSSEEKGLPTHWSSTENVAWKVALPEPGNSTPVVWGNRVFVTQPVVAQHRRTLMCFDRRDGKLLWQVGTEWLGQLVWEKRLAGTKGTNWSSVMLADGLCYTITQGGDCFVFRASPEFDLVAENSLGEPSNSSIVASKGQLFIRTHQHLWCIGSLSHPN